MFKNPILNIIYIYKYVIDSLILKICVQIVAAGRGIIRTSNELLLGFQNSMSPI